MARYESDSFTKKSSKFENFLKKNLDEHTFNNIRAYEACIVCSNKESKAFKYVVLSDECLYLTENPPKTITPAVELEDIFGIELIDDLPDFLSGQEQRNTTHIEINYWTELSEKPKPGSRPSSRNSLRPPDDPNHPEISKIDRDLYSREESEFLSGHYDNCDGGDDDDNDDDDNSDNSGSFNVIYASHSMPTTSLSSFIKSDTQRKASPRLKIASSSHQSPASYNSHRVHDSGGVTSSPDEMTKNDDRMRHKSLSPRYRSKVDPKNRSDSSLSSHSLDVIDDGDKRKRKLTLHLYMLVADSKMLVLIRSAVNNHLIKSTLNIGSNVSERAVGVRQGKHSPEKIEALFSGLIKDLMDPSNSMERNFELIQELKTATNKYFQLKRLFWKSSDLFAMFIELLKCYLPKSPNNVNTDTGRARRADEFEGTEIFPSRLRVMKQQSGKLISDLVTVLTCFPELPVKYVPPTTKASRLLMQTEADKWKCLADAELHDLFVEFTNSSSSVIFELLVIAQQSHWGRSDSSFFNVCWLLNRLEKLDTTEKFLDRLIGQAMRLIQPSKRIGLLPAEAILVFQQFYILHSIISNSALLATYIRNNYTEEFKYYIQGPVLREKLPECYPISARTILLIEEVMSAVLLKKVKLLTPN